MAQALAERIVDALAEVGRQHPRTRAVHAKGLLCSGTFTATPAGARLTRAAHMRGEEVRATVRFSNGGSAPDAPDGKRDGRGLAMKLYPQDAGRTDVVALTLPRFFVRTPEDFLELTLARKPDPVTGQPDMERLGRFLESHPEALPAIQHALTQPAPASYAQLEYNAIHAFRWIAPDGERRWVRYSFRPAAGVAGIGDDEAKAQPRDYLRDELERRLSAGPVEFSFEVTVAGDGDDPDDPTEPWPAERDRVRAGTLRIDGFEHGRERDDDVLVFDPTRVIDGIELSGDPILRVRPDAYAVSVERRAGVARA